MQFGAFEIHALPEGRFTVGVDKVFVPYADGDPPRPGTLFVAISPFLVRTPNDTLLLDAGLGEYAVGRGTDFLLEGLARHGVTREAVTKVLLSHLHFDHAGGCVATVHNEARPTFPNAEYVVQRGELTAPYEGTSDEARARVVEALDREGQLLLVEGDGFLTDEIEHVHTGGHSRDHQLYRLHTAGLVVLFGGDVVPTPGQVQRRFVAKYDHDGARSQDWRTRLAQEAALDGHLALFYHSTEALAGFIDEVAGGFRVEPVDV
ncbi:MAG: MBL fold metallo-hydrolase [Bacteroidota bacterium]